MLRTPFSRTFLKPEGGDGAPAVVTPAAPTTPPAAAAPTPATLPEGLPTDWKEQLVEAAKLKKDAQDADNARLSETEKLKKQAADADARAVAADRRAAAARHGLPPELASRLTGTTEAEIEADALAFKKLFPVVPAPVPGNTGTAASESPRPAAEAEITKKEAAMTEAIAKGDFLAVLRLQREIAAFKPPAK